MKRKGKKENRQRVAILVLGDIGRSPRMLYHARSFSEVCFVDMIGYVDEKTPKIDPNVQLISIPVFKVESFYRFLAPFKVLFQILFLFWIFLFQIEAPDYILLQNPPSIPSNSVFNP